jgi:hypothetical protein
MERDHSAGERDLGSQARPVRAGGEARKQAQESPLCAVSLAVPLPLLPPVYDLRSPPSAYHYLVK